LKFNGDPRTMDLGLLYRALNANQVDMVAGNSTDGPIKAFNLRVLQDDKHYFPPYQAVPLVREEALQRWPQMRAAFDALAGKVSAEEMQAMNNAVDGQRRNPADVVREFRAKKGL
jgi:osmoprotectant transport system substrate-binding protein